MIDLKGKPFYLSEEDIKWVNDTLSKMGLKEKVGQLFCPIGSSFDESELEKLVTDIKPCGIMFRKSPGRELQQAHRFLQSKSEIPLLVAANLEIGGKGIAKEGTLYATQTQVAATDDEEYAYRLGVISAREGSAVGVNWSFAPVVDVDLNFRNPITNTRAYGSDPDRVLRMARAYMRGVQEYGLAVSIKHYPGDGVDERDHHLLASVNTLSVEEWDNTSGKVYKGLIDDGAETVMTGHIMLPEYQRVLSPGIRDEDMKPASLSSELLQGLLREKLGFNGLIVTDATRMTGFMLSMKREDAVPTSIAVGNDIFLFDQGLERDFEHMMNGIDRGILSLERIDEAVTRILALKASLKLHIKKAQNTLVPDEEALEILNCDEHKSWTKECANKAITLVKDKESLLPLSPEKYKKIQLHIMGDKKPPRKPGNHSGGQIVGPIFQELLEKEGFEVDLFDPEKMVPRILGPVEDLIDGCDLVIYFANVGTHSNEATVRLDWAQPAELNGPRFIPEVPTMFISVANPYHLLDIPRVKTFINAYTPNEEVVEALVEKLMGRSEFEGISPIDPFCGKWDTKL